MGACIAAGIYTTNSSEACHYITKHSQAAIVVLEDNKQLSKYAAMQRGTLPHLKAIVVWGEQEIDQSIAAKCPVKVYLWSDFMELGAAIPDAEIDRRLSSILPGHCSTLIYTSGTTGPPKAVMISHDNATWTAKNLTENYIGTSHEVYKYCIIAAYAQLPRTIDVLVNCTVVASIALALQRISVVSILYCSK
jgi:long-chain-fatty-acid--CoA ligase ACSBG